MATIAEEVESTLISTNVTDSTEKLDLTSLTFSCANAYEHYTIEDTIVFSTGLNAFGELGLGDNSSHATYTSTELGNVKNVFSGVGLAMALKYDGTLWATGDNSKGRFGNGTFTSSNVFIDTKITNVKYVAIANQFVVVLKHDGTVWITGNSARVPVKTELENIVKVSTGTYHALALDIDGNLYVYGYNYYGQFGNGTNTSNTTFTLNASAGKIVDISAGGDFSMIIRSDSNVATSGYNLHGELGLGDNTNRNIFVNVGITNPLVIEAAYFGSYIIKSDNKLWGSGQHYDYLGGRITNVFTNTNVSNVLDIIGGGSNAMLTKVDGSVYYAPDDDTFANQGRDVDNYYPLNWRLFRTEDIYEQDGNLYVMSVADDIPSLFATKTFIGVVNYAKPFDGENITPAISTSPMAYTIKAVSSFNSFTLAKVLADSMTYTFYDSYDNVVKTDTVVIDCKRDAAGILSEYPTTVMAYAGEQIEAGGYVSIVLTRSTGNIELGDFTLNNAVDVGFTNLTFSHGVKDYNNYTPDAFGIIPEGNKAIVTTFNITVEVPITNYSYMVSLNESISGKNITVDGSDSNGQAIDEKSVFSSMIRRVRVTSPGIATKVKDNMMGDYATLSLSVQEIV